MDRYKNKRAQFCIPVAAAGHYLIYLFFETLLDLSDKHSCGIHDKQWIAISEVRTWICAGRGSHES
jgi:hypothetical protein